MVVPHQLEIGATGEAADAVDHRTLEHRRAERGAKPVAAGDERQALDLGRVARHSSNGVASPPPRARLEVQRARHLERPQQVGAVVGEALLRPLVEPAVREEIGGVAGRARPAPVLDLDRERKSGAARMVTTPKRNGMRVYALRIPERARTTLISIGIGGGPINRYVGEEAVEYACRVF